MNTIDEIETFENADDECFTLETTFFISSERFPTTMI